MLNLRWLLVFFFPIGLCGAKGHMNDDYFWQMTEVVADGSKEGRLSASALSKLEAMSVSELFSLYEFITLKRGKAYTKEILEVGSILNGMELSDDGFSDFTCWLVFQGREVFEVALGDPDRLVEVKNLSEIVEDHDFDGFCYDILEILLLKARGDSSVEMAVDEIPIPELEEWYEISRESLARRYPMLWKKYGGNFVE